MALAPAKTKKIEQLLTEGKLSKRAISRQEKVSRITIDKIERRLLFPEEGSKKYIRCKGCGGKVLEAIPCAVCLIRQAQIKSYDDYMDELLSPLSSKRKNTK